jgi:glycosyltransferase involved in cell wall biosynthesis
VSKSSDRDTVSVVIGAYNAGAWIGQALDSVLAQTYPVLEVLVIDDGSTDDTAEVVRSFGERVQYVAEQHRGRPHRNRGILASRGDIVAFVDADDFWSPVKLERQVELLRSRRVQWAVSDSVWLDDATGTLTPPAGMDIREGDILKALFLENFIVASSLIVRRAVLDEVGLFDETPEVAPAEDWDLWLRIAARYPVAAARVPLVTLRLHPDSFLAATPMAQRVRGLEHVVARARARESARLGRLERLALGNIYHAAAVKLFRQHRPHEARGYVLKALRQRPTRFETIAYLAMTYLPSKFSSKIVAAKRRLGKGA